MFGTRAASSFLTLRAVVATAFFIAATANSAHAQQGQARGQDPDEDIVVAPDAPEFEGELDVLYEDDDKEGKLLFFLDRGNDRIKLKFKKGDEPNLKTGDKVRVRGNVNLADGTVSTTSTSVTSIAVAPSRTLGPQSVLVILLNFSNNKTQPWTISTINSVNDQVKNFYLESSYGQTIFNFTVVGYYTIAATDTVCDYYLFASQAEAAAAAAGVNLSAYDRRMFAFPKAAGCSWGGMGNLSGPRAWVNGSYVLRTVAHEQGHNLGNYHSRSQPCDSTACTTNDYGDDRDVLGVPGTVGHMNAFQKERLGFLSYGVSPVVQTVTASGDYWIDNYELLRGANKGLKIWNAAKSSYYYIETRAKTGFDMNVAAGVTLHLGSPGTGYGFQVDLAPTTTTWDSTLDVGQVFSDPAMGLTVQTLSSTVDGAMIRVVLGSGSGGSTSGTCTRSAPTVTLSPSSLSVMGGYAALFAVSVRNNNSSSCPASGFSVTATVPAGWATSVAGSALASVAPGASASATLSVTPPAGTTGSFPFNVSAVDMGGGYTGSTTASVSVGSSSATNLSVVLSASLSGSGKNNQAIAVTTTVRNGTTAVAGVMVTLTLRAPSGMVYTLSGVTTSSGAVTLKQQLKPKDPGGTYQVQATASLNGVTATGSTSVAVP